MGTYEGFVGDRLASSLSNRNFWATVTLAF